MNWFVDFSRKDSYSLKNAMGNTKSILPILKERGQTHYAVSNYGEISNWVEQYFTCKDNGIIPILGMETFVNNYRVSAANGEVEIEKLAVDEKWKKKLSDVSDDEKDATTIDYSLDIFAKTIEGYYNIIQIHNDAQMFGVAKRPRTSDSFLSDHGRGVIAVLPTPYSEVGTLVYNGLLDEALLVYNRYKGFFDEVYVSIPIVEDETYKEINDAMISFCIENGIKMLPVINSHYVCADDEQTFYTFKGLSRLRGGMSYEVDLCPRMYYKTLEEVTDTWNTFCRSDVFNFAVLSSLYVSLGNLLNVFSVLPIDTTPKMPKFENGKERLYEKAQAGLRRLKLDGKQEYVNRLEYELDNIVRAGFADYFLFLEDLYDWHINRNGRCGSVGRGSAAGSLVLYCLGVTKVDPIEAGLLFERFLDASRLDEIINKGGEISGADFPDVDCFALDTLVVTDNGLREIGDLNIGDKVKTRDGSYHAIERIADFKNTPVVRVCYGDWFFDCTLNHEVLVNRKNEISYMPVCELIRGDKLVENEGVFIPIVEICNYRLLKEVRDLKIEGKHCYRVAGRAYNKVILKNGDEFYLSDKEL